ncbi:diguanylate cyclase domain-containing protein [Pseudacidovorax intermedius]|uniref:diguanylate cyclase domain-containing protein n=1 Tax=Pseudacidovorax intermedius TaxID=433924 RepID=UPI000733CAB2|nr:diguanylate cyclase [Pseudacidovorax intermedius]
MPISHDNRGAGAINEAGRLQALAELQVMDTAPEASFDDIAWLAATVCEVSVGLVSLIGADRQWSKARCGTDVESLPRSQAFCSHAIAQRDMLEVHDARLDPRFAAYAIVVGSPHVRFYAGMPLTGPGGWRYGTLCVMDTRPRQLTEVQRESLRRLAARATDLLEARRQRILSESRDAAIAELLEALPDGVVTCDGQGTLKEFNRTAREWHGVDPRAMPPSQWPVHFGLCEPDGRTLLAPERVPLARALGGEKVRGQIIVIRTPGVEPRTVSCNASPLTGPDGHSLGAVCTMHDVTVQARDSQAMEALAMTDQLTGLPNRTAWFAELERALARTARAGAAAVMAFIDLDGFKHINDTHGHAAGDEVLRQFAARLQDSCRRGDFIARLSGDEFVVFLDRADPSPLELSKVAARIHGALASPMRVSGFELRIGCSIGFGTAPGDRLDAHGLIHAADVAMYTAKRDKSLPFAVVHMGEAEDQGATRA